MKMQVPEWDTKYEEFGAVVAEGRYKKMRKIVIEKFEGLGECSD